MSSTALAPVPAAPSRRSARRPARLVPHPRRAAARAGARTSPPVPRRRPAAAPVRRPLRLTRRGRLGVTCTAAGALAGVALAVAAAVGEPAAAGGPGGAAAPAPLVMTVLPGQTLSQIAAELAPGEDWRDVAAEIAEVNGLPSQALRAGQRLTLPAVD
ncbi:LysM peptidoglycan-binding domain-containing protein [Paenibacillus sp. TRM 82003]|uniref:LysM peptidoglycan-binding domain-containing protein n=1 Tax=Kineococcus sp. TRM81007 TaxID=2925831 RepID=UPI001F5718FB|nr:LysM peptidoglycan-binding domain-containing protein [Kineococcus sp. TRM81007]MCI2240332.1 LysM peptidoglycan-binding domain-containing protein [Kineococcus sp. TRM81007]MCI3927491.1 LysM peptidoglycan-binding domain-containing protein [Paenibacillus sp. TRM 82003]